jgi:hypothetical protein
MARDNGDTDRSTEHKSAEHKEARTGLVPRQAAQLMSRSTLTAAGLIGLAALLEPELLVGMAVGAGIAMSANWLPDVVGGTIRPMLKTAIKAGYTAASTAREMLSEASESVQDIVAEARSESGPVQ